MQKGYREEMQGNYQMNKGVNEMNMGNNLNQGGFGMGGFGGNYY